MLLVASTTTLGKDLRASSWVRSAFTTRMESEGSEPERAAWRAAERDSTSSAGCVHNKKEDKGVLGLSLALEAEAGAKTGREAEDVQADRPMRTNRRESLHATIDRILSNSFVTCSDSTWSGIFYFSVHAKGASTGTCQGCYCQNVVYCKHKGASLQPSPAWRSRRTTWRRGCGR